MSTITTIQWSDVAKDSRSAINTNFSNLNTDKIEWPSSATDNAIARFDGITWKLLQNSWATIDDSGNVTATNLSWTNTWDETTTTLWSKINWATEKTNPVDADMVWLMDSAASNVLKKLSWANIKATLKTYFDTVYAKYSGDADFYQYSISRTVSSGNLIVSLKNFEGNDPTTTKPVKIMIWGVVRTISGALSFTANSWTNYLNLGSAELATKEADIFTLLQWNTTTSAVNILWSRFPSANTMSDMTNSSTWEKGILWIVNYNSTDSVVNIWRFNATLSAGAGYTWSIPATSIIVNRPINETRKLEYISTLTWFSSIALNTWYYKLIWNELHLLSNEYNGTSNATTFTFTTPFAIGNTITRFFSTNWYDNWASVANMVVEVNANSNTHSAFKAFPNVAFTAWWLKAIYVPNMIQII